MTPLVHSHNFDLMQATLAFCLISFSHLASQDPLPEIVPVTIAEHSAKITNLVVDPKGKFLYTADSTLTFRAWDVKKGEFVWEDNSELMHEELTIVDMDVGGERLIFSNGLPFFGALYLKDGTAAGGSAFPMETHFVTCIAASPKGKWVWFGTTRGGLVRLTEDNGAISTRKMDNGGTLCFARDQKYKLLGVGGNDGSVRFVNPTSATRQEDMVYEVHDTPVTALAFDAKSKKLVVGAESGALRVIQTKKGKLLLDLESHKAALRAVAFDAKGNLIASGDESGAVVLWDAKSGMPAADLTLEASGPATSVIFLAKGTHLKKGLTLVAITGGSSLVTWDLSQI